MRYSLIILLLFSACQTDYLIEAGENQPKPITPIMPLIGHVLEYEAMFTPDWFGTICENDRYGLKRPSAGRFNYHSGGAGWQFINGMVAPRYYAVSEPPWQLFVGEEIPIEPNRWYRFKVTFADSTRFYLDGAKVWTVEPLPHGWITPSFLGKGTDTNYNEYNEPSGAAKELTLKLNYL